MLVLPKGVRHMPGRLDPEAQAALVEDIRAVVTDAPLFVPAMPRTGKEMSVRMTNCGPLGWVTDKDRGYRYQPTHPVTGRPWPPIPARLLELWREVSGYPNPPEACLVNFYTPMAKMGLHQDRDEQDFDAPVVSPACFVSAERGATMRRNPSGWKAATSSCWAARGGSPSTASIGSILRPRRC
jgi:alkylated DNA repair protein (DNA oxidative demethylase)